jgi:hypothetical protein
LGLDQLNESLNLVPRASGPLAQFRDDVVTVATLAKLPDDEIGCLLFVHVFFSCVG